jgi:hypothetical protein
MNFTDFHKIYTSLKELLDSIESVTYEVESIVNPFSDRLENDKTIKDVIETNFKVKILSLHKRDSDTQSHKGKFKEQQPEEKVYKMVLTGTEVNQALIKL